MHRSIPQAAQLILLSIYKVETGKSPPECYEVIYAHKQDELPKPITQMTLDEVEAAQAGWSKKNGSSAAGAAQFMKNTLDAPKTLRDIEGEMGLTGKEKFNADLQDRMAYHLLKRRGFLEFMSGKLSRTAFGNRLAMEWASFPVLSTSLKGAHRTVKRGQTYYAGDGVNKVLTKPAFVEDLLDRAFALGLAGAVAAEPVGRDTSTDQYEEPATVPAAPNSAPDKAKGPSMPGWVPGLVIGVLSALVGFVVWIYGQIPLEALSEGGVLDAPGVAQNFFGGTAGEPPIPRTRPDSFGSSILLSLLMPIALSFIQPIVAAAAAWIVSQITYWWFKLLKVNFDQRSSERLHGALERAIYAGVEALGARVSRSKLQSYAADYAERFNADDVKRFKLSTEDLKKLAVPHIGKIKLGGS